MPGASGFVASEPLSSVPICVAPLHESPSLHSKPDLPRSQKPHKTWLSLALPCSPRTVKTPVADGESTNPKIDARGYNSADFS